MEERTADPEDTAELKHWEVKEVNDAQQVVAKLKPEVQGMNRGLPSFHHLVLEQKQISIRLSDRK